MGGAISKVIKTVAGPIISAGKSFVQGLFGRAKQSAQNIAHRAIDTAKQGAVDAIKTGDIRGSARTAWKKTKDDAVRTAQAQFDMEKQKAKAAATAHIQGRRKELLKKADAAGVEVGAGFGAAHFKRMERHAHSHINKVFADAKRHTKKAVAKRRTKKEFNSHKKDAARTLAATHKGGVLKLNAIVKDTRAKLAAAVKKGRGGGVKVGAGFIRPTSGRANYNAISAAVAAKFAKGKKKGSGGVRVPKDFIGRR